MARYKISLCTLLLTIVCAIILCGCSSDGREVHVPNTSSTAATTTSISDTSPNEALPNGYKIFTSDGIQLRLPALFVEKTDQHGPVFYNKYSAILIEREPFTEHPSLPDMSLDEYCKAFIASRNMEISFQIIDGLHCWDYEVDIQNDGILYNYFVVVYKTATDFWIVEFVSDSREAMRHRDSFITWAKMIEFTE